MVISFCISNVLKYSFRYANSWRVVDNFAWKLIVCNQHFYCSNFQASIIYYIHIKSHQGYLMSLPSRADFVSGALASVIPHPELILFQVH
uniref:Uncharacterized protein n=1 Tax=Arundo donax TaxID=35708 RepID=A0A0A9FGR6_ARUDO